MEKFIGIAIGLIVLYFIVTRIYRERTIKSHLQNVEAEKERLFQTSVRFGFGKNDTITEQDIEFRYEHLKALVGINQCTEFASKNDLDNTTSKIREQLRKLQNAEYSYKAFVSNS